MKCKACGYNNSEVSTNYSIAIENLYNARNDKTQKAIKHAVKQANKHIPSEQSLYNVWRFMQAISGCSDEVVCWAIDRYISARLAYDGKGLSYLRAIILNHNVNRNSMIQYEKKRMGSLPPEID
jgi:hypothetical protein|tara:strand:- start:65 stop:436 length:372 start_codon:yes stop_codon:yes gene_type:complete